MNFKLTWKHVVIGLILLRLIAASAESEKQQIIEENVVYPTITSRPSSNEYNDPMAREPSVVEQTIYMDGEDIPYTVVYYVISGPDKEELGTSLRRDMNHTGDGYRSEASFTSLQYLSGDLRCTKHIEDNKIEIYGFDEDLLVELCDES